MADRDSLIADALKVAIPIVVASVAWLLGQVSSLNERVVKAEQKLAIMISDNGEVRGAVAARNQVKHELEAAIATARADMDKRVTLLESRRCK
jgi:cation transport ATPase